MGSSKTQTIGYRYYLGMHMELCHGPIDAITQIDFGERTAWTGNVTATTSIYIDSPDLFGGEQKEGGIQGDVDILFGEPTQGANAYLVSQLGSILPAFRGVVSLIFKKCYMCAMSPYIKRPGFKLRKLHGEWYAAKSNINNSANAAHIIYAVLTNPNWGMGLSPSSLDLTTFTAVADTLYAEGFGLSFVLASKDNIENFIYSVLTHVNGVFYAKPSDGKFALKLLRNDYSVGSLLSLNEANIITLVSFERPSPAEMVNEIVVKYRPQGTAKDSTLTVQDLAGIQFQEGVISQSVDYPGIDTYANASKVALRDLNQKTIPLARVTLKTSRVAWNIIPGDCVKFSWTEYGIVDMVIRVLKVDYGDLDSGELTIQGIQDIFSLPSTTYITAQASGWTNPIQPAAGLVNTKVIEATYWDIATSVDAANLATFDNNSAFFASIVPKPLQATINYEMWVSSNGGSTYNYAQTESYCPTVQLNGAITITQTSIPFDGLKGLSGNIVIGGYAYIDNEIVRIDAINTGTGLLTIGRGCVDTVPVTHVDNSLVYFTTNYIAVDPTEHALSETLYAKLRMRTPTGLYALASATAAGLTMVARFGKPYPPGNLRIGGVAYPVSPLLGAITVTWSHRDRTLELATLIDHTSGSIGPETGVTYSAQLINVTTSAVVFSTTGVTGTSWSPGVILNGTYAVEVWSVRGGVASWQKARHQFDYIVSGWGYGWGDDWGGTP